MSELDINKTSQDWGSAKKDRSVDGHPLTMAGRVYPNGVGTHATSLLRISLEDATRFTSVVGIDDEVGAHAAPVRFSVIGDGKTLWASRVIAAGQPPETVDVDLKGVKELTLLVDAAEDGIQSAHVNWANAKIDYTGRPPVTVDIPTPPVDILTPAPSSTPRINGASVFGVRPGHPVLYTVAATGDRPMTFTVDGLPEGVSFDPHSGQLGGSVGQAGEYKLTFHATNALGTAERKFRLVVGETIALTPPLGWNSWNCWGEEVDQEKVLRSARALVKSGLVDHGWTYINIDDTWQGVRRGPLNAIQPEPMRFPDMKALCDEIHALGLKIGIYSSPWMETYGGRIGGSADNAEGAWTRSDRRAPKNRHVKPYDVGSYSFAANDAKQWAAWGFDYLKYDWGPVDVKNSKEMSDALRASGRDVVYSLSNNAAANVLGILEELGATANAWRTTNDINDTWNTMSGIGFAQDKWAPFQKPGRYNDADMLVVGHVGWGRPHPTKLKPNEQYTHLSLWALLGSPLLIGCDLEQLDPFTLGLLTNDEVLAVSQDPLCRQGVTVVRQKDFRVVAKEMEDGSLAVGLFNVSRMPATVGVNFSDLKLTGPQTVRDVWRQKDVGELTDRFETSVPAHGVMLVRVTKKD